MGFLFFPDSPPPGVTAGLVCLKSGCNMSGYIDMNFYPIYNAILTNVTLVNATFQNLIYVNATQVLNPPWVLRSGDNMTGDLWMGNNNIYDINFIFANRFIGLLDWSNLTNVPSGFADGIDNTKQAGGQFLYNDTTTIYFNGTLLNNTIEALDTDTDTDTHIQATPPYLYDNFIYMYFNETHLNGTIIHVLNSSISILESDPYYNADKPRIAFTNETNVFLVDQKIMEDKRLFFRNMTNETYMFYNTTTKTVELWVNGNKQQDWGNSTRVYGKATFYDDARFGNLTGNAVVIDTSLLVIENVSTYEYFIGNGTLITDVCHIDGTDCPPGIFIDTHVQGTQPWLYNDSINMYFNESYFNNSIYQLTGIFEENVSITVSSGIGYGVTVDCCNGANEILQIAVFPTTITNKYRFYANETIGGETVDSNRALHTGNWIVAHAGSIVEDDAISYYLSNVQIDESFIVRVRYQR